MRDDIRELLAQEIIGNTTGELLLALGVFLVVLLGCIIVKTLVLRRLHAALGRVPGVSAVLDIGKRMGTASFAALALYIATRGITLPETIDKIILALAVIVVIGQIITLVQGVVEQMVSANLRRITGRSDDAEMPAFMRLLIRITLWSVGMLLVLSNLGINVTSLVAGLGIGGIAIALALQNILGDLFSSFSLYFDKPFQLGDFIIVGDHMGTVKNIGLKTTRIQALQGEEIVIPNMELTSTRVRNFKKMLRRRIEFRFGVTYSTTPEQLRKIPKIVKESIDSLELCTLDRAHFKSFGDSSLDFEVVYFVESGDYNLYMDRQQSINLGIMERCAKEGIEFAFPTRTVHLVNAV